MTSLSSVYNVSRQPMKQDNGHPCHVDQSLRASDGQENQLNSSIYGSDDNVAEDELRLKFQRTLEGITLPPQTFQAGFAGSIYGAQLRSATVKADQYPAILAV